MDITAFIRELLFGHDCVIVPGFGGFIGNYNPARIDKTSGTFYPPVKQISFNRNLNHNDGLLIGRISGTSNVNYGDAKEMVEQFVVSVRKKLGKGEKVVFDNIGSFINNSEGNVQFEPDRNANYHLDSYGLEPFQCSPLEGYDVRKRIVRHSGTDAVRQASFRKILWRAAVIIPLLSLVVIVPLKTDLFKNRVETTTMNPLVAAEFEHNKLAVDESQKTIQADNSVSLTSAPVTEAIPVIVEPAVVESEVYMLITGSFKQKENAESQAIILKEEGFTPEVIEAPNGFYRVSALKCNDLGTALEKKDSISKKFPEAWVSRKR